MSKVCYILGAGFSRSFGFPLMNDFMSKAKRIVNNERTDSIHKLIQIELQLDRLTHHTNFDINNIENLLSFEHTRNILEKTNTHDIQNGICDVVKYYESKFNYDFNREKLEQSIYHALFANGPEVEYAGCIARWISAMSNAWFGVKDIDSRKILCLSYDRVKNGTHRNRYGIITLNYDCTLDKIGEEVFNASSITGNGGTRALGQYHDPEGARIAYYKLHGTTEISTSITPPTWQKGDEFGNELWVKAYHYLQQCSEIRIIGYSLPESDSYMKYFMGACISKLENLENIDIIDPSPEVGRRFNSNFKRCRFKEATSEDYFNYINTGIMRGVKIPSEGRFEFGDIDRAHHQFMNS